MRKTILVVLASVAALFVSLSLHVQASKPQTPGGALEWEARDSPTPALTLVAPLAGVGWFGPVNAPVYFSWGAVAHVATFYLPSPGHPSTCPVPACYTALVAYRSPDLDPTHALTVLRFPNGLPFVPGQPGDPVTLVPGPGGTLRWRLP